MSHTPGPWVAVTLDSEKDPVEVHRRMLSFGQGPVFLVHAPEHPDATADFSIFVATVGNGPTSSKNARLISAAPDLLEALQDLTTQIRVDEQEDCLHLLLDSDEYKAALSAIAKATGEGA